MSFGITSFLFFVFLAVSLLVYYVLPIRFQWIWLLISSFVFIYLAAGPLTLPLLIIDITVIWGGSRLIDKSESDTVKKWVLRITLILIVSQLVVFKYYNNMTVWINHGLALFLSIQLPTWQNTWLAPVGVSYFSLSAIGYLLDVYWKTTTAEKNPLKVALLVAWFPALISGPIVKYRDQYDRLFSPHSASYRDLKFGFERILWGLFKKMVVADRIAIMTSVIFADTASYPGLYIVIAVVLFAFQIYCDFSGCMDIVIGVSEMFQVTLPENFNRPFFSSNLSEFWRRWHISLGTWAKEYIMYPLLKSEVFQSIGKHSKRLFGKKFGKNIPTYIGMLILWVVIGIWHGGSAKFILAAGIVPWFLLVGGQLLQPLFDAIVRVLQIKKDCFSYRLFSAIRTLCLMCFVWLIAMAGTGAYGGITAIGRIISGFDPSILFNGSINGFGLGSIDFKIIAVSFLAILCISGFQEKGYRIREALEKQNIAFQWIILLTGLFFILIFGIYGPEYNPADFIYAGF